MHITRVNKLQTIYAYATALLILFVAVGVILANHRAAADSKNVTANNHIITVHDDGKEIGFITEQKTLRQALVDAKVSIDPKDRTEPSLDENLTAASYQVNIYRARPVLIKDGNNQFKIITSYRTGKQVAKDAGIELHDADLAILSTAQNLAEVGAPEVLTIKRATPVSMIFYGKELTIYTFATSVGELLEQKNIKPASNDTLMPAAATKITSGMRIEIWKNGEQSVTIEEDIPFETDQVRDSSKDRKFKEIQTPGVNGKKSVTYKIIMQNGKEVRREALSSIVVEEPKKQVEVIGTKVNLPPGSHTDWMSAAGIAEGDYGIVEWLIQKESGWNPSAMNRSSGACGLVQALPCSKLGPEWDNPVVALKWGDSYVKGRYGGWAGAYDFWQKNKWY